MDGLDSMIVSLYAGGMTVREIRHHLETTLGAGAVGRGRSTQVTDAVCDAVMEWQNRPLEEFYPVIYLDAIRIKVRADHRVTTRSAHIAVGVDMDGYLARAGHLGPGARRVPPSGRTCARSWPTGASGTC